MNTGHFDRVYKLQGTMSVPVFLPVLTGDFDSIYKLQGSMSVPVTIKTTKKTLSQSEMASLMRDLSIIQKQSTMRELPTMQDLAIMCEVLMPEQTIMQEAIMQVMASFMQEEATTDSLFQEGEITVT